ncbi:MAG: glycosyltransferase [Chitinivibrionales bacterium]|nr:glycosyltransferase [Chitinivibrionales bacterium]MBD3396586.1 glycosyltransferase [Chitinivibrionales bacterium]
MKDSARTMSGTERRQFVFLNHWAARLGGAELSLLELLDAARDRWDCHLVTTEDGALPDRAARLGITCHVVPCGGSFMEIRRGSLFRHILFSWREWLHFAAYLIRLRGLVKHLRPVLIHANIPKSHVALFLLRLTGCRAHACFHIREIFGRASMSSLLYRALFPSRNASVIAISGAVKARLPFRLRTRAAVIYNGVGIAPETGAVPKKDSRVLNLLYLGRIVPWKGCRYLIEILDAARKRYPDAPLRLDLVGDTAYWSPDYRRELVTAIQRLGLGDVCRLHPRTDTPAREFALHDVFCNASFEEPFGRSIAEAHACGLPVVAYDSGGIREIVVHGETGFLVPYGDKASFVEALGRFVAAPALARTLGANGRKRAVRHFDCPRQQSRLCEFLAEQSGLRKDPEH